MDGLEIANRHMILVLAVVDPAAHLQYKNGANSRNHSGYYQATDSVTGLILAHAYLKSNELKVLVSIVPAL